MQSVVITPSNTPGSTFCTRSTTFAIWNASINSTTTTSVQTLEFLTSKTAESCFWMSASFTRNLDRFSREVLVQTVPRRLKEMRISWPSTSTTQRDSDTSSSRLFSRCLADGVPSESVSSPNFPYALLWIFSTTKMHSWIFGVNVCLSLFNMRILVSFYVKLSLFSHLFLFPPCPPQLELQFGASAGSNCVLCSFYSCSLVLCLVFV